MTTRCVWRKACSCDAPAFAPAIITEATAGKDAVRFSMTWHPGPVCDECKTPWTLDEVEKHTS